MEPSLLDKVQQRVKPYAALARASDEVGLWLGEGASAGHGGIDNVSNAFESGFWYLDELGQLARLGVGVMCRQQITSEGYRYGLAAQRGKRVQATRELAHLACAQHAVPQKNPPPPHRR